MSRQAQHTLFPADAGEHQGGGERCHAGFQQTVPEHMLPDWRPGRHERGDRDAGQLPEARPGEDQHHDRRPAFHPEIPSDEMDARKDRSECEGVHAEVSPRVDFDQLEEVLVTRGPVNPTDPMVTPQE